MKILIYEPLPDINRAPFIARLAVALQAQGHEVLLALEERLIYTLRGALTPQGVINCRGVICAFIASNRALRYIVLPASGHFYRQVTARNLEAKQRALSVERASHYRGLLDRWKPDLVIIWNGQAEHQRDFMDCLSGSGGCDTLFLECGWFPQRDYFYWDRDGVNARSSIAGRSPPELDDVQREQVRAWKRDYTAAYRDIAEQRKLILVPLQVDTDSNVTLHSPFASMAEFLQHLVAAVRPDYRVIVRPHPLASYPYDIDCGRSNFQVDRRTPLYELIAAAEYVIGINSTVLLEALAFEKKVLAFGRGIFDGSGAIGKVGSQDTLPPQPSGALSGGIEEAEALLFDLVFRLQIPVSCRTLPSLGDARLPLRRADSERSDRFLAALPRRYSRLEVWFSRLKYAVWQWLSRASARSVCCSKSRMS